jgi:preprotein translocase subunit SecA
MNLIKALFGDENKKALKEYENKIEEINSLEEEISNLDNDQLKEKTKYFRSQLKEGKNLDDILPEAFAVVRETSKRMSGERHYDVQLIGGMILHDGKITEMRTGEGKTLTATLPTYLNALAGSVHVITVNDYLARRDAVWMGQIYSSLGLSVSVINGDQSFIYDPEYKNEEQDEERDEEGSYHVVNDFLKPCTRREAYNLVLIIYEIISNTIRII